MALIFVAQMYKILQLIQVLRESLTFNCAMLLRIFKNVLYTQWNGFYKKCWETHV